MKPDHNVLIAIPAKNEQDLIGLTIMKVAPFGDVFVFDNNSNDKTSSVSVALGAKVVRSSIDGYEQVLFHICKYFLDSHYEILVIIDGDGEVGLSELPVGLEMIDSYDGVVGTRDIKKRIAERLIARLFYFRTGISDIYCGFKILKKSGLAYRFRSNTFATGIINKRARFANIPVEVRPRVGTRLGGEILIQVKLFWCGLRGLILR